MSLTFHVDIVSAEGQLFSGPARRVFVPGERGELGILPRHAPLLARLKPGLVRVIQPTPDIEMFFISGGFVEVQPYVVTILADTAMRSRELDELAARTAKERVEKELNGRKLNPDEYNRLKAELNLCIALLRTIEELRTRKREWKR